jgi:hypothetical protein
VTEQTDPILVDNVSITSTTEDTYSALNAGDNVSVTAFFSEPVIVTDDDGIGVDNASGTPTLTIAVGSDNRTATYLSGSTSNALVFQYTIQSGDTDINGISIGENSLALNSGTIRDASGNYATITHSEFPDNSSYKVDNTDPTLVDNVSITNATSKSASSPWNPKYTRYIIPDDGSLCNGDCYIFLTATFNENVTVTGSPQLTMIIGDLGGAVSRTATYLSGDNSTALIFRYTARTDDPLDTNGIKIDNASGLGLNSVITIKDLAGNDATTTFSFKDDNNQYWSKNM